MCLDLKETWQLVPATKSMLVFKNGNNFSGRYFEPRYRDFRYELNKPAEHVTIKPFAFEVNEGYHSYPNFKHAIAGLIATQGIGLFVIEKGVIYIEGKFFGKRCFASESLTYIGPWYNPKTWWKALKINK